MAATSPHPPGSPHTVDDSGVLVDCEPILSGYRHHDFPDLSSRRFAPDALQSISQPLDLTVVHHKAFSFAAVVAATARVLGAYCGCQDVLLGILATPGDKILPVRVTWDESQTWEDVTAAISEAIADPCRPQLHPDLLRGALDLSAKQSPALALVSAGVLPPPSLGSSFPITLVVGQESSDLSVTASERIVHRSQCTLILSQVIALATHAVSNPQSSVAALPQLPSALLSSNDRQSFEERLSTYHLVPPTRFAMDHVTLRAAERPDGIAVRWFADLSTDVPLSTFVPETITNLELEEKANQLGRWLLKIGLQKGRSVAICMKRDIMFHIAFIGVLRAGGCYVPIDAELPAERQQFIAKDSEAQFILSTSDMPCFSLLGNIAIDVKDSAVQEAIEQQSAEALLVPELDDLSYILYTSGTTGTPKGCILTHRGLSEAIWALSQFCASAELSLTGRVNYLSIASVAFDVHIAEIMVALAVGIPILSAPRSLLLEDLPYYVTHLRVSHMGIVPSLIEATMGAVQETEDSGISTSLRYIASGGEKMSDAILDKWASHPTVRLANFYGPSEVTIGCAARMMDKDTPRGNIGLPFANVAAFVVDENMNIVLRGGIGELVVEGPLVGCGYVGRPDLTQKAFLKFPDDGTDRWAYRTGDLVRMMADGTLEIIGRIDTQIKLRGVRIESEGISSIIRSAAAPSRTLDVMTILAKHPAIGVDQLASFIAWDTSVPVGIRKGGKPSLTSSPPGLLQSLRGACERELASYMRPSHIIPLTFIPLSSNGKADAKVLTALFLSLDLDALTGLMDEESSSPTSEDGHNKLTEMEQRVAEILGSHVKVPLDRVGPRTNLFELGLDSLAVTRFAADLRRAFNVIVSPARVMQSPAVSSIATLIDSDKSGSCPNNATSYISQFVASIKEEVVAAYAPDAIASILPPFPVQEGILYRSANAPTMYVQHVLMRLTPDASVSCLRRAWGNLITRHEMLRTVFHFGTDLVQVVLRAETCPPRIVGKDVPDFNDASFQGYFYEHEASIVARDLNTSISIVPPVRLTLFTNSASCTVYAALSIHHALYDGISLPVLLQDLEREYIHQPQLPSASLQQALEHITLTDQEGARTFWTSYLKDYPWERLLNKTASSAVASVVSVPFVSSLSELQMKAARQQVTLQALLMGAYGSLLAQHLYDHDDVVFGVIRTGRTLPIDNIETTICPMITVVPARVRLAASSEALQNIQRDIARVNEYEHVPLSRIQKWTTGGDRSLFDTLFSVSFTAKGASKLWSVLESRNPEPDYILAVEIVLDPEQDTAVVHAAYTSSDISSALVVDILRHLEDTAVRIAETSEWSLCSSRTSLASPMRQGTSDAPREDPVDPTDIDQHLVSKICDIASQFLRVDIGFVKATTSLLSLGLDSIKSVGLSRKLSAEGMELSSADIMRLSTPLRLAALIQRTTSSDLPTDRVSDAWFVAECDRLAEALNSERIKLSADDNVQVYPISILQAGMLSQTISSCGRLYVHLFPFSLSMDVDIVRLRDAWKKAIATFDILRTSFHFLPSAGVWSQVVHSSAPFPWLESQYDPEANLTQSLNPFLKFTDERDFFRQPPIMLHLLKGTSPDYGHRLVLVLHHALYDGLAIARLFDAVKEVYCGLQLPAAIQYHQMLPRLLWQEKNGASFWVKHLRDLRVARITRKPSCTADTSVHQVSLPVRVARAEIHQACRHAEITPQCIGQAAFAKLLSALTHCRDVIFGRVVSGRDSPGAEEVIGPMLNTVPCRVLLQDSVTNRTLLKRIHDANVASMPWQHASLRAMQKELRVSSLWDGLFVFQPSQESLEPVENSPWTFDAGDVEDIFVQYPLNVELHETDAGFVVKAACTSDIVDAPGLRTLVERYAAFLCDIIRCPDEPWSIGIPETASEVPATKTIIVSKDARKEPQVWNSRFDPFRELLSTTTKAPSSKIFASTSLTALGIDSITAVQIVAKARRLGFRLTAAEIVRSRTVGDLLLKIEKAGDPPPNGVVEEASVDVSRARWSTILPPYVLDLVERVTIASPGMEWMIGMWQRSKGSRFQHVFAYRVAFDVEPRMLQDAWNRLLCRHAILRSTFAYDKDVGAPRVVVFKAEALHSSWFEDLLPASADSLVTVQERMKALVSNPPSVDRPITRAVFMQSPEERYLLIHLHHFQYDAWSLPLLIEDLLRLYASEHPTSSNDLDSFLQTVIPQPQATQERRTYWEAALSHTNIPGLFPSLCNQSNSRVRSVYTDYAAISGAAELDKRARNAAISLQSIFLASWAQVHGRHTASDSVAFSLWHSGRTADVKNIERLAAPCINVLPFTVYRTRDDDTVLIARRIQDGLQARSTAIEQSRLVDVHEWGAVGLKPLTNVFVNIIKVAPDVERTNQAPLEPIQMPYYIPEVSNELVGSTMRVTELIQDDIMIDIIVDEAADKIVMSIEFAGTVLDTSSARSLLEGWATGVRTALEIEQ
ncbi:peptide synthetase [Dichomitus squalens LYAD-421 SS1]|uniref:peptide synthetase n=1 Tax=Dichomitus squalens (strain LYAD-421) TaxID=732165 RepID=UPI0004412AF4|nr:peptide synthetase [Dichomitus squalens LYAD-421 SS1]EJF65871.1 peptide synthetase [Dichomitus squalens LYAD-421 SS1]